MAEFLAELYVSRSDAGSVEHRSEQARRAAADLTSEGTPVRYLRSIFVPDDETCFYLYEAERVEDVEEAARRASLSFERIAEAAASRALEEPDPCL